MFLPSSLKRLSGEQEHQHSKNKDTLPSLPNNLIYVAGGATLVPKPYRSLDDFKLYPDIVTIFKSLRLGGANTTTCCLDDIQMNVAPNIVDGADSFLVVQEVGLKSKLKRISSYILPILHWMIVSHHSEAGSSSGSIAGEDGPKVVIICASISSALAFQKSINFLLSSKTTTLNLKTRVVFSGMKDYDVLLNSSDILITNITSATEILAWRRGQSQMPLKTRQKLKYVILEEVEDYLKTERGAVQTIIAATSGWKNKNTQERELVPSKSPSAQIVVSGRKWTKELQALHLKLTGQGRKLVLYMEALSEILMFANTHWRVDYAVEEKEKLKILKDIITEQMSGHKRSVIACTDIKTAYKIFQVCEDATISCKNVTVRMNPKYDSEGNSFDSSEKICVENREILILTDDMITTGNMFGCSYLISFNSDFINPHTSEQPIEKKRLWYLWPSLPKLVDGRWTESDGLVAHFMMTGEEPYFFTFFKFTKTLNNTFVHPHLEDIGDNLIDKEIKQAPICKGFELFGNCNFLGTCTCRHTFNDTDFDAKTLAHAPCYGEIEIKLTETVSASEYNGLLLAHYAVEGGKRKLIYSFKDELSKRNSLLEDYYSSKDNQLFPTSYEKGGVYAIKIIEKNSSTYKRVKIMGKRSSKGVVTIDSSKSLTELNTVDKLDVMFIDTPNNSRMTWNSNELLLIPHNFCSWSPLFLRLILTNMRPPNQEPDYVPHQVDNAKYFMAGSKLIRAKVIGSRESTVWVNPITFEKSSQPQNLRSLLINNNATAVSNPSHEKMIIESFRGVGKKYHGHLYVAPQKRTPSAKEFFKEEIFDHRIRKGEVQWAHVDKSVAGGGGNITPVRIRTTSGEDPWLFYGIHIKFQRLLVNLEDELNAWISAQPLQAIGNDGMAMTNAFFGGPLETGSVVAVKDRLTETWMRGLITEVDKNEGEEDNYFKIFFVDYGDGYEDRFKRAELYPLPTMFVTRIPFQAIAFRLNHIHPVNESNRWKKLENNYFLDMLYPRDQNGVGIFVAATNEVERENFPPCRYYDAVVVLPPSAEEVGSMLVKHGNAITAIDIDHFVEEFVDLLVNTTNTSTSQCGDADDDDDDDDENDIAEHSLNNTDVVDDIVHSGFDHGKNDIVYGDDDDEEFYRRFDFNIPEAAGGKWKTAGGGIQSGVMEIPNLKLNHGPGIHRHPSSSSGSVSTALGPLPQNNSTSFAPASSSVELRQPTVFWHQTPTQVILTVALPEIQEYSFKISLDQRSVSCKITSPPNYGFQFKLFGKVKTEPDQVMVTGQQLRIKLGKRLLVDNTWIRIFYDKTEKLRWLKKHPDFVSDDDDEDNAGFSEDEFNSDYKTRHRHLFEDDNNDSDTATDKFSAWIKTPGSTLGYNPNSVDDDNDEDEFCLNDSEDESFIIE